jgi:microcystin-dependent protein
MTPAQYNGLLAAIQASTVASVGTIILFGKGTPPGGYLPCDGAAVSRTTYAALFAVIQTAYGAGDGSTTFNVPDMQGRFPMGVGSGSGLTPRALGSQGGAEGQVVAQANLAAFSLPVTDPGHLHDVSVTKQTPSVGGNAAVQGSSDGTNLDTVAGATIGATTGVSVASGGSGTALPVMNPFTTVGYFIKT